MNLKTLFICKICNNYYEEPVNLGCFCVVCKWHTKDFIIDSCTHKVKCLICKEHFDMPGQFKENMTLKNIIENDEHLYDESEKALKNSLKASRLILERLSDDIKPKEDRIEALLESHLQKCKEKVEERKALLVSRIDLAMESLLEQLAKFKEKYVNKSVIGK